MYIIFDSVNGRALSSYGGTFRFSDDYLVNEDSGGFGYLCTSDILFGVHTFKTLKEAKAAKGLIIGSSGEYSRTSSRFKIWKVREYRCIEILKVIKEKDE